MRRTDVERAREAARIYREQRDVRAARRASAIYNATRAGATITASRGAPEAPTRTLFASRSTAKVVVDGDQITFPVVPFVEGVRRAANAPNQELYLVSEFSKAIDSALMMPVVFEHPMKDGEFVSMLEPPPYDPGTGVRVGFVTSARFDESKMVVEVAAFVSKLRQAGPAGSELADALIRGEQTEVSIGHFANVVPVGGIWPATGEAYFGIHTEVWFDHLALLGVNQKGACSGDDGCSTNRT